MKNNSKQNIIKAIFFVFFTVIIIFLFRNYSVLRPAAYGALYKEYVAAIIVVSMCLLNYAILFPFLYRNKKYFLFFALSIFSATLSAVAEVVIVFPQISEIVRHIDEVTIREYFTTISILLSIRNLCFVGLFFLLCLLEDTILENRKIKDSLRRNNNLIIAKRNTDIVTIPINEIVYCQQIENYTYLYNKEGNKYSKNCSLRNFLNQLDQQTVVRISRNVIVFYQHIRSFDDNSVYVCFSNNTNFVGFQITDAYRDNAIKSLKKYAPPQLYLDSSDSELEPNQSQSMEENVTIPDKNDLPVQSNEIHNVHIVAEFIGEHPDCKGSDIAEHLHVSLSTVNRILAQLKAEGLVEYVGSKKTGGYRTKATNTEP